MKKTRAGYHAGLPPRAGRPRLSSAARGRRVPDQHLHEHHQFLRAASADRRGNFVVTWGSCGQTGDEASGCSAGVRPVFGQRFVQGVFISATFGLTLNGP